MGRKKTGKRSGAPTWALGSQLTFLESRRSLWLASPAAEHGSFYSNVTWLFLKKYGWDMRDNEDPDPDEADLPSICDELSNDDDEAVQKERRLIFKILRKVFLLTMFLFHILN
jgi:hypothetical protein